MNWLMVAVGGMSGAVSRYAVMTLFINITRRFAFPWAILSINIIGSLLAGIAFALAHERQWLTVQQQHLLSIGFLGGFTTYSSYSVDCVRLMQSGQWLLAGGYVIATTVTCLFATMLGIALVRAL